MPQIVHLTVLNPARHTRIYGKLARSQQRLGYTVGVVGQDSAPASYLSEGIEIHPIAPFGRGLGERFRGWVAIVRRVRQLQAQVWVLHAPELLWLGLWLRWFRRDAVIYDVHEDYAANLVALGWPRVARVWRWVERWCAARLSAVSYAEYCYENMLAMPAGRYCILPNAFEMPAEVPPLPAGLEPGRYWLYTGTLAGDWGIFRAVDVWAKSWHLHQLPLVLAGHTQKDSVMTQLQAQIAALPAALRSEVKIIGGRDYVPYPQIVSLIQHCYAGLGLYAVLPYLKNKIFTKYHEFCALGRPLVFPANPVWEAWGEAHRLGVVWHENMPAEALLAALAAWQPCEQKEDCFWKNYESRITEMLINNNVYANSLM